jgi:thiamine biosynthesis protein ThiI
LINIIIVHHHEITLKGGNRGYFERQLMKNIHAALSDITPRISVSGGYGKFIHDIPEGAPVKLIEQRLANVFGISNICSGVKTTQDISEFCRIGEALLKDLKFSNLRVDTRRPDKNYPKKSMVVNAEVGGYLCDTFKVRAEMTNPDVTLFIELIDGEAYVYSAKLKGAMGLPIGVSGKVACLISAGFDSPVAAWRMMRRGAQVEFVHFHSVPYTDRKSIDQVRSIVQVLTKFQYHSKIHYVPFADAQNEIVLKTPAKLRMILYRRMMVRIAEAIGQKAGAEALVTGEAVGQVASQTLRNIRAIDGAALELPILRPLSGADKEETMDAARAIGTYDICKEPYDDCCSFLAPRKPETWANLQEVEEAEKALDVPALVEMCRNKSELETIQFP